MRNYALTLPLPEKLDKLIRNTEKDRYTSTETEKNETGIVFLLKIILLFFVRNKTVIGSNRYFFTS